MKEIKSLIKWGFLNLMLSGYILIMIIVYWNTWELNIPGCTRNLSLFIVLIAYIQFFEVLRKVVLVCIWKKHDDPGVLQSKIDFFHAFLIVIPEFCVFIYGNVILFKPNQENCQDTQSLWNCCLVVVIYGYFYMAYALGIILFFIGVLCLYKVWSRETTNQQMDEFNQALDNLPIL